MEKRFREAIKAAALLPYAIRPDCHLHTGEPLLSNSQILKRQRGNKKREMRTRRINAARQMGYFARTQIVPFTCSLTPRGFQVNKRNGPQSGFTHRQAPGSRCAAFFQQGLQSTRRRQRSGEYRTRPARISRNASRNDPATHYPVGGLNRYPRPARRESIMSLWQ